MFFRESERRSKGMWMYSVKRMTDGAWMESFWEWSIWPLCSSTRATPLKIMTTARLSVHTLIGSKEVFRTKTLPFIWGDITRARKTVSKYVPTGHCLTLRISLRPLRHSAGFASKLRLKTQRDAEERNSNCDSTAYREVNTVESNKSGRGACPR